MADPDRPWDRELTPEEIEQAEADWPEHSPAQQRHYMKLRLRANYLKDQPHPDDPNRRMLGGPQPNSGRKSTRRMGEDFLEYVELSTTQKSVRDAFDAGLEAKDDPALRAKTAAVVVKLAQNEESISIRREEIQRELDKTPLDEVRRIFAANLAKMIERGDVSPADLAQMFGLPTPQSAIEGTATEDVAA